jgi:small-conductance mechanosensitive channel
VPVPALPRALGFAILAVLLLPAALAQDASPVLVQRIDAATPSADVGAPAIVAFRLFNLNPEEDHFVTVELLAPRHWRAQVEGEERFFLAPRNETQVVVRLEPVDTPRGPAAFEVTFAFVHGRTGEVVRATEVVEVDSAAPPRVLGVFPNPLPPPLDNAYGTFVLDMAFWVIFGIGAILLSGPVLRMFILRARSSTVGEVVDKLRRPLFMFILLVGLARSFAILPRNGFTEFVTKSLLAIAVTVFGLYVAYRALDGVLVYYQRELAPRTATKVDDVLVPAFRKVGLVIVYIVGIVITLRRLGWDPTLVFAGAGIAGLVIAFAAQDTFSNLFSGVFLMLDRPFVEGDDIMLESGDTARVVSIGLRTTRLHNYATYEDIIVPNNQLATRRIVNHTSPDPRYRLRIELGVAYGTDPAKVERVLLAVAHAHPRVEKEGPLRPSVRFTRFGESSLEFLLRVIIPHFQQRNEIGSELRFAIVAAFDREGIEIPFPQRVLHLAEDAQSLRPMNQNP